MEGFSTGGGNNEVGDGGQKWEMEPCRDTHESTTHGSRSEGTGFKSRSGLFCGGGKDVVSDDVTGGAVQAPPD